MQWTTIRETHVVAPARPDAASYVSYAYNLRTFSVYSRAHTWLEKAPGIPAADAVSTPGYPLFLTAFMRDKPDLGFMYRVVTAQAILGVLTTLLVFLLARMVLTPPLACVPALLTALTPQMETISTYLLTESLFTALLVLSTLLFAAAIRSRRPWQWALAGTVFALCCLVRPTLQLLLPLTLVLMFLVKGWRRLIRPVALATACWVVLLLPWFAYKESIPTSQENPNLLRASLYHGSFPDFMYEGQKLNFGYPYRDDPHAAEIMASYAGLEKWVGARVRAEPLHYLQWYLIGKPRYFLSWYPVAAASDIFIYPVDASPFISRPSFQLMHALMVGLHWPLMLFGIGGALLSWVRPQSLGLSTGALGTARLTGLMFLSAILLHMIGAPFPRYSIPFRPLAFILAVAAAVAATRTANALRGEAVRRAAARA
ncbi:glycosyltransferase family 39 protein [Cognatiluteimonas profundi]|uniref:glycosyltransferase family 39 protein n=1 Tax=Cognatiluteimonas profundi TaxID=2594501 RepID=UPI00131CD7D9|nr:glycosyltransferase family 39 protein [Lysobacter profundi]